MGPLDGALPPSLPQPAACCPYCLAFRRVSYKWDCVLQPFAFGGIFHLLCYIGDSFMLLVVARFSLLLSGRTPLAGTWLSVLQ